MREHINLIESALIEGLKPSFLAIQYNQNPDSTPFIHVVISHSKFANMEVVERVSLVYKTLADKNPENVTKVPVIVEAFASKEMVDIIEYIK